MRRAESGSFVPRITWLNTSSIDESSRTAWPLVRAEAFALSRAWAVAITSVRPSSVKSARRARMTSRITPFRARIADRGLRIRRRARRAGGVSPLFVLAVSGVSPRVVFELPGDGLPARGASGWRLRDMIVTSMCEAFSVALARFVWFGRRRKRPRPGMLFAGLPSREISLHRLAIQWMGIALMRVAPTVRHSEAQGGALGRRKPTMS